MLIIGVTLYVIMEYYNDDKILKIIDSLIIFNSLHLAIFTHKYNSKKNAKILFIVIITIFFVIINIKAKNFYYLQFSYIFIILFILIRHFGKIEKIEQVIMNSDLDNKTKEKIGKISNYYIKNTNKKNKINNFFKRIIYEYVEYNELLSIILFGVTSQFILKVYILIKYNNDFLKNINLVACIIFLSLMVIISFYGLIISNGSLLLLKRLYYSKIVCIKLKPESEPKEVYGIIIKSDDKFISIFEYNFNLKNDCFSKKIYSNDQIISIEDTNKIYLRNIFRFEKFKFLKKVFPINKMIRLKHLIYFK